MSLLRASWTPWRISRRHLMIHRSGGIGPHREGKAKPFESHFRGRKGEVCIVDTTLRDGEQTAGVVFATREKVRIARLISEVGVREMEVGTPWLCPEEREAITEICALGLESRTLAFCQAEPSEIELAAETGVDAVVISAGVSEIHLRKRYVKGREWVLDKVRAAAEAAKDQELAAETGVDAVVISAGVSEIHLRKRYVKGREWVLDKVRAAAEAAKDKDL